MANLKYNLVQFEGQSTLTVFVDGGTPKVANDTHPYWTEIRQGVVIDDDPAALDLFDLTAVVAEKFQRLSERVTVHSGRVFFDGDVVHNTLTEKVVEFIEQGVDDWKPLVNFYEKVQQNPQEHSREQLFDWLANNVFTINEDGDIVGYKGFYRSENAGFQYRSVHAGTDVVTVDGVSDTGYVHQNDGSLVEMARSAVTFDPSEGCSHGLHVSNYQYAKGYGQVVTMVLVNPRDVVSVPTQDVFQKMRVSRYRVVGAVDAPVEGAVRLEAKPVEVETPAEGIKVTNVPNGVSDFSEGDKVLLTDTKYYGFNGEVLDDLEAFGVEVGQEGVVVESYANGSVSAQNVYVDFGTSGGPLWVSPESLELVSDDDEDEDEEDDEWYDDYDLDLGDYSW